MIIVNVILAPLVTQTFLVARSWDQILISRDPVFHVTRSDSGSKGQGQFKELSHRLAPANLAGHPPQSRSPVRNSIWLSSNLLLQPSELNYSSIEFHSKSTSDITRQFYSAFGGKQDILDPTLFKKPYLKFRFESAIESAIVNTVCPCRVTCLYGYSSIKEHPDRLNAIELVLEANPPVLSNRRENWLDSNDKELTRYETDIEQLALIQNDATAALIAIFGSQLNPVTSVDRSQVDKYQIRALKMRVASLEKLPEYAGTEPMDVTDDPAPNEQVHDINTPRVLKSLKKPQDFLDINGITISRALNQRFADINKISIKSETDPWPMTFSTTVGIGSQSVDFQIVLSLAKSDASFGLPWRWKYTYTAHDVLSGKDIPNSTFVKAFIGQCDRTIYGSK